MKDNGSPRATPEAIAERAVIVSWLCEIDDAAEKWWLNLNWFQRLFNRRYKATHARLAHAIIRGAHRSHHHE